MCPKCVSLPNTTPCPAACNSDMNFDSTPYKMVMGFKTRELMEKYFKGSSYQRISGCNGVMMLDEKSAKKIGPKKSKRTGVNKKTIIEEK